MVKQVTMKEPVRVGGAGVSKSAEDFIGTYAYQILTDKKTLEVLANLPVGNGLEAAIVTLEELKVFGYNGVTAGSGMQRLNSVFAGGMKIPFKAMTASAKRVDDIETEFKDVIRIYRTGENFDPNLYSTTEAGHESKKTEGKIIAHEDAPDGLVEAIHNWIAETAQDWDAKLLKKIGLDKTIAELAEESEEEPEE
jgi:hypothetical protein